MLLRPRSLLPAGFIPPWFPRQLRSRLPARTGCTRSSTTAFEQSPAPPGPRHQISDQGTWRTLGSKIMWNRPQCIGLYAFAFIICIVGNVALLSGATAQDATQGTVGWYASATGTVGITRGQTLRPKRRERGRCGRRSPLWPLAESQANSGGPELVHPAARARQGLRPVLSENYIRT
jgi:hypothetical protein